MQVSSKYMSLGSTKLLLNFFISSFADTAQPRDLKICMILVRFLRTFCSSFLVSNWNFLHFSENYCDNCKCVIAALIFWYLKNDRMPKKWIITKPQIYQISAFRIRWLTGVMAVVEQFEEAPRQKYIGAFLHFQNHRNSLVLGGESWCRHIQKHLTIFLKNYCWSAVVFQKNCKQIIFKILKNGNLRQV